MKIALDFETRMSNGSPVAILGFALAWVADGMIHSKAYEWSDSSKGMLEKVIDMAITGKRHENGELVELVFHNSQFELRVLRDLVGIVFPVGDTSWYEDTYLLAYEANPQELGSLGLDALANKYLNEKKLDSGVTDWETAEWNDQMSAYCKRDAKLTVLLWHELVSRFDSEVLASIYEMSKSWAVPLSEMEANGLRLDIELHKSVVNDLQQQCDNLLERMRAILPLAPATAKNYFAPKDDDPSLVFIGKRNIKDTRKTSNTSTRVQWQYKKLEPFNPNSTDQIIWGLTHLYGWNPPPPKRGKTKPSMDSVTIESLLDSHPTWELLDLLLEYSKANKLVTAFGDSLAAKVDEDGRVRGRLKRGTITHRLSCSEPNLQQIPKRSENGSKFRQMFVASPGNQLVVADKSQFQLKIIASLSHLLAGNDKYLNLLLSGLDAHTATQQLLGVEERTIAKNANFGCAFGVQAPTFQRTVAKGGIKLTLEESEEILAKLDSELSLSAVKKIVWQTAKKQGGYYITPHGHVLYYPDICKDPSRHKWLVLRAERQLFNAVIQSWESYVMLNLASVCQAMFRLAGIDAALCSIVHDELLVECTSEDAGLVKDLMTEAFTYPYWLPGFEVTEPEEAVVGLTWKDAK